MTREAREAAVNRLFPLLRATAARILRIVQFGDIDDLVGDGAVGLLRAIDTFDPNRGASLEHYARRVVTGAMLNGLRRNDAVSERVRRTIRLAERRRYELAMTYGRLPTLGELERTDPVLANARRMASRAASCSIDGPRTPERCLISDEEPTETRALRSVCGGEVRAAVARLPKREREVVALHYGGALSMRAIGRRMQISPQRVSQLHSGAIARLRALLPAA